MCFLSLKKRSSKSKELSLISLLPVSSKIFERILYDSMITFFTKNSLISQQQPGFKPSDSCTNQLQSIMYQIYESFDDVHEVRSVFLHMSKAFISYGMSTAQKMKFSIEDFFSKCDQIRRNLRVESHLLKKSLVENFIFCAVKGLILKLEQNGISGNVLKLLRQLA